MLLMNLQIEPCLEVLDRSTTFGAVFLRKAFCTTYKITWERRVNHPRRRSKYVEISASCLGANASQRGHVAYTPLRKQFESVETNVLSRLKGRHLYEITGSISMGGGLVQRSS